MMDHYKAEMRYGSPAAAESMLYEGRTPNLTSDGRIIHGPIVEGTWITAFMECLLDRREYGLLRS